MPQGLMRDTIVDTDPGGSGEFWNPALHDASNASGNFVEFYWNEVAEAHYCRIRFPADKLKIWDQPVREEDKINYRAQWMAYENGVSQFAGQTMLQDWKPCDEGSRRIYNEAYIQTVEQLASLPDSNFVAFPTGHGNLARRHREMAKQYLEQKRQMAGAEVALEAVSKAKEENAQLQRALQLLTQKVEALEAGGPVSQVKASPVEQAPEVDAPDIDANGAESAIEAMERAPAPGSQPVFPRDCGGGSWYELSDGTRVQGRQKALDAQKALNKAA